MTKQLTVKSRYLSLQIAPFLDVLLDSEYVSGLNVGIKRSLPKYFCIQFKILNILLGNDPNAEFFRVHIFPYSDQKKPRMDTFCTVMVLYFTYLK